VKNLLTGEQEAAVTVAVDALMSGKSSPETQGYLVLDPKGAPGNARTSESSYKEAIVFLIGGGNYNEWSSLASWASRAQPTPKSVIYGATDILNGEEMLETLEALGRKN
jgi:hypothetical protein